MSLGYFKHGYRQYIGAGGQYEGTYGKRAYACGTINATDMLFHKKTQKVVKTVWIVVVVLVIISMIALYIPAIRYGIF